MTTSIGALLLDMYLVAMAEAKFLVPDWEDIVDSGEGLSNQPAMQATEADGPVRQKKSTTL